MIKKYNTMKTIENNILNIILSIVLFGCIALVFKCCTDDNKRDIVQDASIINYHQKNDRNAYIDGDYIIIRTNKVIQND